MKKILILACIFSFSFALSAQKFYIKPYAGYGISVFMSRDNLTSSDYFESPDTSYYSYGYQSNKVSLAKGIKFGFSIGTDISKNIAFELSADYSKGKSQELSLHSNYYYHYDIDGSVEIYDKYILESRSLQIAPGLVIKSSNTEITPYIKLGIIIGFSGITENLDRQLFNTLPDYYPFESWTQVMKYKWTPSVGLTTALGCDYHLFDNFYAFTEARYNSLSLSPASSKLTEFKYRGEDRLETLNANERNFEFVEGYTDKDNIDPDQPRKELSRRFELNNISVIAGIRINFNKNKNRETQLSE